ncbi:hypothetical protein HMPREF2788_09040 [Corynebacterium sp. HMSC063F04]|nr:hypothetical protein HMPREF2788_09040 [Corynebacterium sp. HMSC063F04]
MLRSRPLPQPLFASPFAIGTFTVPLQLLSQQLVTQLLKILLKLSLKSVLSRTTPDSFQLFHRLARHQFHCHRACRKGWAL